MRQGAEGAAARVIGSGAAVVPHLEAYLHIYSQGRRAGTRHKMDVVGRGMTLSGHADWFYESIGAVRAHPCLGSSTFPDTIVAKGGTRFLAIPNSPAPRCPPRKDY